MSNPSTRRAQLAAELERTQTDYAAAMSGLAAGTATVANAAALRLSVETLQEAIAALDAQQSAATQAEAERAAQAARAAAFERLQDLSAQALAARTNAEAAFEVGVIALTGAMGQIQTAADTWAAVRTAFAGELAQLLGPGVYLGRFFHADTVAELDALLASLQAAGADLSGVLASRVDWQPQLERSEPYDWPDLGDIGYLLLHIIREHRAGRTPHRQVPGGPIVVFAA
jgi:hypothetical protein